MFFNLREGGREGGREREREGKKRAILQLDTLSLFTSSISTGVPILIAFSSVLR